MYVLAAAVRPRVRIVEELAVCRAHGFEKSGKRRDIAGQRLGMDLLLQVICHITAQAPLRLGGEVGLRNQAMIQDTFQIL